MSGCPDFLVVGHVAKDIGDGSFTLGGTAAYAALTARNLGWSAGIVTRAGSDLDLTSALAGVLIERGPSEATTTFQNLYRDGKRHQVLHAIAARIQEWDVPTAWRNAPVVLIAPLVHEIGEGLARLFPTSIVGLTPQGWLRQWDEKGVVAPRAWLPPSDLPPVHAIVLSLEDIGGSVAALRPIAHLAQATVLTLGAGGATLFYGGQTADFPAIPVVERDPTGAGDVFAAAFLIRWAETGDPFQAARFANCTAGLSVTGVGLAGIPTRKEVDSFLRSESIPKRGHD